MKNHKLIKRGLAIVLILLMLLGLCSCGLIGKEETTTETTTAQATVTQAPVELTKTLTDGAKTVVYPTELETAHSAFPVIVWANGTGMATDSYAALLQELAKGGYIVVADASTMTADGTSQRSSIDYILEKNGDSASIFYNKINTNAIGACGHSQGGRSCINAAQADSRIKCVVSIAGASSEAEAKGLNTPCLFLTGTNDMVVASSKWCKPSYDAVTGRAAYASLYGGIHTTCMINPKKVSGYTLSWFDAYLLNDAEAKAVFEDDGKLAHDYDWQDFENKN